MKERKVRITLTESQYNKVLQAIFFAQANMYLTNKEMQDTLVSASVAICTQTPEWIDAPKAKASYMDDGFRS